MTILTKENLEKLEAQRTDIGQGGALAPSVKKNASMPKGALPQRPSRLPEVKPIESADVIIVGGSYVGLSLAVALKGALKELSVVVIDQKKFDFSQKDLRAFALTPAVKAMFVQLGIWEELKEHSQAITEMRISDTQQDDPVRPTFLTFHAQPAPLSQDTHASEQDAYARNPQRRPLAYMVETRPLTQALYAQAKKLGVHFYEEEAIKDFQRDSTHITLTRASGAQLRGRLLVAADGRDSQLRRAAGIKTTEWAYGQTALVCTVAHERPHHGCSWQNFFSSGPFALLPLKGNRASIVWSEDTQTAQKLLQSNEEEFLQALEKKFGHALGKITLLKPEKAASQAGMPERPWQGFPLVLRVAHQFVQPRFVLIGDAAHAVHPLSGQGLNLGLYDVALLAQTLVDTARLGLDIGSTTALKPYARLRRFEVLRMALVTDSLARLFSNDNSLLRGLRTIGLGFVDKMPRLKDYFIAQASGEKKSAARLLRGEPL